MIGYIGNRLLQMIPVLFLISLIVFMIMHALPGDPAQLMLAGAESGSVTPERLEELRAQMGLNDPLVVQYWRFISRAARGDLGVSIRLRAPVTDLIMERFHFTIQLSLAGLLVAVVVGLSTGILAALNQNSWIDTVSMIIAYIGVSMPLFWLGLILILLFSFRLKWFPPAGGSGLRSLVLPAITLGFVSAGIISRLTRSSLIETLNEDYVRVARAKGLPSRLLIGRHALKNAFIPIVTILGLQFGGMLAGAVVTETVFSRPGLGRLVVSAILWKDYPLVQGIVLFFGRGLSGREPAGRCILRLARSAHSLRQVQVRRLQSMLRSDLQTGAVTGGGAAPTRPGTTRLRRQWTMFTRNRGAVFGLAVLLVWILIALLAPQISPHDPLLTVDAARQPPASTHWFGTDRLGRDVLSRVIFGARISLLLGIISVAFGSVIGTLLGLVAGYFGGNIDHVVMRIMDAMLAFPGLLLALIIIATLGPSIQNVMIAVGFATIPQYARLTRGSVLSVRELPYVDSARVIGSGHRRIVFRHVLPNVAAPLIVLSTLQVGNAILVGAGLSFLGLGAQPPTPEWGLMAAEGREVLGKAWWISTFPGLAILSVVMALNLMGDGLRGAWTRDWGKDSDDATRWRDWGRAGGGTTGGWLCRCKRCQCRGCDRYRSRACPRPGRTLWRRNLHRLARDA